MKKIFAFLFDIDGTLVDCGGAGRRAMTRAFYDVYGVTDAFRGDTFTGRTDIEIFKRGVQRHLKREATREEQGIFFDLYLEYLEEEVQNAQRYRVMPGVEDVLKGLSQRPDCVLGLCTGNVERGAYIKLRRSNLLGFFRFGGFGSDSEDRTVLTRLAMERAKRWAGCDVEPIVIGDSLHDFFAAKENGFKVALVATGYTSGSALKALKPDFFFRSFSDSEMAIARLLGIGSRLRVRHNALRKACDVVGKGGVIIYPTSTVYGLGGNALNEETCERVRKLKGRDSQPFIVLVGDMAQAQALARLDGNAYELARRFWPGALTLVLKASDKCPDFLKAPDGTIAIRIDSHPFVLKLCKSLGVPIISTSANYHGKPAPSSFRDVEKDLVLAVDLVVEDETPLLSKPSTVVRVEDRKLVVLREGALTKKELSEFLKPTS
jgi:tRNA threonylcarbamoyl adenosine modification protein (Sua5/YciO/YrdC/YwlC family)